MIEHAEQAGIDHIEHTGAYKDPDDDNHVNWERTHVLEERMKGRAGYSFPDKEAIYGRYTGRPMLGSNMPKIIGGVYLGAGVREAVVVDDKTDSDADTLLRTFYQKRFFGALERMATDGSAVQEKVILQYIYLTVLHALPYNGPKVDDMINRHFPQGVKDNKVHLASFVKNSAGVCRHQSLLVAYLIEKLQTENHPLLQLSGKLSLERNKIAFNNENIAGAHAWTRYTAANGEVWIIDVAQKCFGRLRDLQNRPGVWEYKRPED